MVHFYCIFTSETDMTNVVFRRPVFIIVFTQLISDWQSNEVFWLVEFWKSIDVLEWLKNWIQGVQIRVENPESNNFESWIRFANLLLFKWTGHFRIENFSTKISQNFEIIFELKWRHISMIFLMWSFYKR